jgi:four helix bundle protein
MRDYNKLVAFKLADEIAVLTHKLTQHFPKTEVYGITSQMRRAAVSVPSNIVEGCSRESQAEYLRFLEIANGSLKELHYQFSLACKLNYIKESDYEQIEIKLIETEKVLGALIRSLRS